MIKYWAYIHINGELHLKRYFSEADIDDAMESPFVKKVIGPFEAESREDAVIKANKLIGEHK